MSAVRWKKPFNKNFFEREAWDAEEYVCGIDEVGRGCLSGPVVAAAVILHKKTSRLLKDSKILTHQERLKAYAWLQKNSVYGIAFIHNRIIDQHNIYHATLIAMKRAFIQLMTITPIRPRVVLIDAMPLNLIGSGFDDINVLHFPFGETKSTSIAAASIIAKISRDQLMTRTDSIIPGYFSNQNKGYATVVHKNIIHSRGASIIHRNSFLKFVDAEKSKNKPAPSVIVTEREGI